MTGNLFENSAPPDSAGEWFTAHCDGGSRGNPGPSGYGAVVEDARGQVVARLSRFLGMQTNNYAEYSGLLAVLAMGHGERREAAARGVGLRADGEADEGAVQGEEPGAAAVVGRGPAAGRPPGGFEMRHTLRGGNKEADRLANEAMDCGWKRGA